VLLVVIANWPAAAQSASERVDFSRDIQPIFASRCQLCHGAATQMSGLRLDSRESALKGGKSGERAIVPGDPAHSRLFVRVTSDRPNERMPPAGDRLTAEQIAFIRRWIEQGAVWPEENAGTVAKGKDDGHWAFRPLNSVRPPQVGAKSWATTPIDQFILGPLEAKGIRPNEPASRQKLIRRLTFDLIGLPPSPEEVEVFVRDRSPQAYERLVDGLLASPHFGERWGRHWLDAVRYADSAGYEEDRPRPNAYHYRDFVIRSLNADMPYDMFLKSQLAGDLMDPDNPDVFAATGFLTAGPDVRPDFINFRKKDRYDELDDVVATTGSAVLGLTLGCARCHDHKYDPIPKRDYYRLIAFFNSTERDERALNRAEGEAYDRRKADYEQRLKPAKQRLDDWLKSHKQPMRLEKIATLPISDADKALLRLPEDKANEAQKALRDQFRKELEVTDQVLREKLQQSELSEWDSLAQTVKNIESTKPPDIPRALAIREGPPKKTHVLERGDPDQEREEVIPGFLSVLTRGLPSEVTNRSPRMALAQWLVDVEHGAGALTARVIVNRIWQHHFGRGLVATAGDFGSRGERPSHPELLDWLASELVGNGWHLKAVHKLILMSAVYQQSTTYDERRPKVDPENRLWWRRQPERVEGEVLRDTILSVSGCLNRKVYGPLVKPRIHPDAIVYAADNYEQWPKDVKDGPATWRRSIYIYTKRSNLFPFLQAFDGPSAIGSCARRNLTTVAPQALALLNDEFVREQTRRFAERILWECPADPARRIDRVYELALGRKASRMELARAVKFVEEQAKQHHSDVGAELASTSPSSFNALVDFCQIIIASNEFIYVD
jgi:mono/diheme cytochrome c family protein